MGRVKPSREWRNNPRANLGPLRYSEPFRASYVTDALFLRACSLAKVKPSGRQYSKWRQQRGKAYSMKKEASQ